MTNHLSFRPSGGWAIKTIALTESFDYAATSKEHVSFGYTLTLPFRLRTGSICRYIVPYRDKEFEVHLVNRVKIATAPPAEDKAAWLAYQTSMLQRDDLWTDVLVVARRPTLKPEVINAIRTWNQTEPAKKHVDPPFRLIGGAINAINRLIIAYSTATGVTTGGDFLRQLSVHEFMDSVRVAYSLLHPADYRFSDVDVLRFSSERRQPVQSVIRVQSSDGLHDLAETALAGINRYIQLQESFIFYELLFDAKAKMADRDHRGALLLAVVALEAAHGEFVSRTLPKRLPAESKESENTGLAEDFQRELGFKLCCQLTPYLFMEPAVRPDPEDIKTCVKGITYRNEIMHGLRKKGKYRIRSRSNRELEAAYVAILRVCDCYRKAVESEHDLRQNPIEE